MEIMSKLRRFKCLNNEETEAHVAWSTYFTVGEVYEEMETPEGLEGLAAIVEMRGDSLMLKFDDEVELPLIVPIDQFEEVK